ncbi:MAG: ABC transporter ATP-binding protein/permease [Pseudomonadales bacterium]|nr:ABC transporter ATP-binding protein/permease [Pseudomonadales bacterium]
MRPSRSDLTPTSASWSSLTDLLPYLLEFRLRIAIALVCLVAAKLASVGLPFVLKDIVDQLDTKTSQTALLVLPLSLLLAYGIVRFANVLFGQLRDTLFGRVTERAMRRVGYKVFAHLHALDLAFHLDRRTGGLSRDIERGVNGISFLMRFMVFNIVPTFLEFGLVIGLLAWNYEPAFALIVFVAVVAYIGFSVVATEWRTRFIREVNLAESRSSTRSIDSLINFETVKYFTNEQYESDHYDTELANWENARRRNRLTLFALNAGQTLIIAIATTLAMILAGANVVDGTMTIGDFVLINAMMIQVFVPLNFLGFVYREMKSSLANIEAMFALLKIEAKVKDLPHAKSLVAHNAKIEFTNVSFAYQPEREILHKVNFALEPRQKLAIVGSSGSGKSTIMKLLFRFYDCTSGSISIDGQNINSVSQSSLRAAIGVVPQDTVLFNASIFDNIRYGRVDASDDDVWEAIRMAHLYDFIERLPEREKTRVGERGLKLSGGEKQRVAIARAVLKRPPIMIFDEATSSLDSQSEQSILAAIAEIAREHTSIVIAHRLSTIVDADSIVVLEQGQLIEQGTHAQLLRQGGKYLEMWTIQQKDTDPSSEASSVD